MTNVTPLRPRTAMEVTEYQSAAIDCRVPVLEMLAGLLTVGLRVRRDEHLGLVIERIPPRQP